MSKTISIIVVIALVVAVAAAAVIAITSRKPQGTPYKEGRLIDANKVTGILHQEDGDPAELAVRILRLAQGDNFTDRQIDQIEGLTANMFEELRGLSMDIELLQIQVRRLQEQLAAE